MLAGVVVVFLCGVSAHFRAGDSSVCCSVDPRHIVQNPYVYCKRESLLCPRVVYDLLSCIRQTDVSNLSWITDQSEIQYRVYILPCLWGEKKTALTRTLSHRKPASFNDWHSVFLLQFSFLYCLLSYLHIGVSECCKLLADSECCCTQAHDEFATLLVCAHFGNGPSTWDTRYSVHKISFRFDTRFKLMRALLKRSYIHFVSH